MLTQGETLRGRYKIIRRLGQGGMGAVYEAHDNVFDTSVALKEVILDLSSTHNTQAQEMAQHAFEREAKILAKINHETIPHVKDYFTEDESQFLVMELVDGDDLAKLLQERGTPFEVETIISWTDQLLDALDYLHTQNPPIIHRDIKPQNLKLTTRRKIKLLDFGIAKGTESQAANTIANQTFVAATLNYSPIEQMLRVLDPTFLAVITHKYSEKIEKFLEQNADVRSDLYALGATLYHLVTNVSPAEAVKRSIETWDGKPDPLHAPDKINPDVPPEFSGFLLKAMEIERDRRFSSAEEMRRALHDLSNFRQKPSMIPTVEMSAGDFSKAQTDSADAEKMAAKTFVLENPPNTGGAQKPPITDAGDQTAQFPPPSNPEIVTEVPPPRQSQQQQQEQRPPTGGRFTPHIVSVPDAEQPPPPPAAARKSGFKYLLLIPVFGLLLILFGGAAGAFYYFNYVAGARENPVTNQNSEITDDAGRTEPKPSSDDDSLGSGDVSDSNIGLEEQTGDGTLKDESAPVPPAETVPASKTGKPNATPKPAAKTAAPTPRRTPAKAPPPTPAPTPRKTPAPKKTPKNMNCIFTDDC